MKAQIQERARELGFDDCRVTTALPPETNPQFERWLAARQHGEMAYLERNATKRMNPQLVLPRARSIITVPVSYAEKVPSSELRVPSLEPSKPGTLNLPLGTSRRVF